MLKGRPLSRRSFLIGASAAAGLSNPALGATSGTQPTTGQERSGPGPTWIEVALNGSWGRERQPRIPISLGEIVEEAAAATREGAAVVHFHAYDEATGRQNDDWELYARIIEGIRSRVDVIAYPTIPRVGSWPATIREPFRHLDELARRGLLEWIPIDPGSANFARYDRIPQGDPGIVYLNPGEQIVEGFRVAAEHNLRPTLAIYEPGFTRFGAALAATHSGLPTPVYRFMFSDQFAWGFPPKLYALDAHLRLLDEVAPGAPWMVAGLG